MPERLHIKFGDGLSVEPKPSNSETPPTATSTCKKRKRNSNERSFDHSSRPGSLSQDSGTLRTAEGKKANTLSERRKALIPFRQALPIWKHSSNIRQALRGARDVLLLVGETGSGKSTQVPQFLLTEDWCRKCIAITQPRRVAAISLAKRVAEEMGSLLGSASPTSKVGYSVRFDTSISPCTRIKFLTEGMLLQEMLRDPWLRQYSAVVLDEIHERSVNGDLLLGLMRNIVTSDKEGRDGEPLKLVVMSATAEMDRLHSFFSKGFGGGSKSGDSLDDCDCDSTWSGISSSSAEAETAINEVPTGSRPLAPFTKARHQFDGNGNGDGSQTRFLTEGQEQTPNSAAPTRSGYNDRCLSKTNGNLSSPHIASCSIKGRNYPVNVTYLPEPTSDWIEAALTSILQIHVQQPLPGDILVFLTGQDIIEALEKTLVECTKNFPLDLPRILVLPLFAALPQSAQQRVFQGGPPRTRKVILSTNIAETSVTVPGVRFVIDSGKAKIKHFNTKLGLDTLLTKPISQSAAIQRKGRAGREAPGVCYRLYTEKDYLQLQRSTLPEILRCDLCSALLGMKARGIDEVMDFPFLDKPPRDAIEKALFQLYQVGALTDTGQISDIGTRMAKLPLSPMLGRTLVEAGQAERNCLLQVIDIVACLSVESIFLAITTEEKKEEAEEARKSLSRREGDHLTLLTTVQAYAAEETDRRAWAERHLVSHRAMQRVMDIRKQLRKLLGVPKNASYTSLDTGSEPIIKSLLRGFATQTAILMPDGSYKTSCGNQLVTIHPSSVLFGKKLEAIMFTEWVFTNKSYARGVSAAQLNWIEEALSSSRNGS